MNKTFTRRSMRLYIDSSVIGGVEDRESPDRVRISERFLKEVRRGDHEGHVSTAVLEELGAAPEHLAKKLLASIDHPGFRVLEEEDAARELAKVYAREGLIRDAGGADRIHLAIASVARLDAVVSWNFRDLVNPGTRRLFHAINLVQGWPVVDIASPEEVIHYDPS